MKIGDRISYRAPYGTIGKKGYQGGQSRIETGTIIGQREGKFAVVPDRVYSDPIAAREPKRHAIRVDPNDPTQEIKRLNYRA